MRNYQKVIPLIVFLLVAAIVITAAMITRHRGNREEETTETETETTFLEPVETESSEVVVIKIEPDETKEPTTETAILNVEEMTRVPYPTIVDAEVIYGDNEEASE